MESAFELVVYAAFGHFFERGFGHGEQMLFAGLAVALEEQVDGGGVRKFWRIPETPVADIEKLRHRTDLRIHHTEIEFGASASKGLGFGHGFGEGFGGIGEILALILVGVGDGEEDAAEAGAAVLVLGREISTAEKWFPVGHQEAGERPAALPTDGTNGGLIAGINVGSFVAIDFHGDEMLVDDLRDGRIFVALAVDHMAPVAPDRADVEQDGLALRLRGAESVLAPFMPVDRLMRGGTKVRTGGMFEAVFGHGDLMDPMLPLSRGLNVKGARRRRRSLELCHLLQVFAGAEVARVERLAAGVAFVLLVIVANAIFAEFPAQINFLVIQDGGEI